MKKVIPYLENSALARKNAFSEKEETIRAYREVFTSLLTHDIKTPTIAQIRSLELLLSGAFGNFNEEQKEILSQTLESCKYMYNMIKNALCAYKFENQQALLLNDSFDFYTLAKECCIENSSIASAKGQNIALKCLTKKNIINADRGKIKHAIVNILTECISRAYENTQINVLIEGAKESLVFSVNINTKDIPPDILSKIFDKSPQGVAKFNKIGSAIRLHLAQRIINEHCGYVLATSQNGNTTLGFMLPY